MLGRLIGRFWAWLTRRQIREIKKVLGIIEEEAPEWLVATAKKSDTFADVEEDEGAGKKIDVAIKVYRLRRDFVQNFRQCIWVLIAIGGSVIAVLSFFKVIQP